MTKLTWLGAEGYEEGETPPDSCTWGGIVFPVGVAVDVDEAWLIAKAKGSRFFKVEDEPQRFLITGSGAEPITDYPPQWREPETEADPADVSFFDDPPGVDDLATPPDYPPEDEPARKQHKRKRGRPPKDVPDANNQ